MGTTLLKQFTHVSYTLGFYALPAEQPDLLGAGQSTTELLFLRGVAGGLIHVPGKFPLFLLTSSHSLAVDFRPQVWVDAESHTHTLFFLFQDHLIFTFFSLCWTADITCFCFRRNLISSIRKNSTRQNKMQSIILYRNGSSV